jgi:hypothetical protein
MVRGGEKVSSATSLRVAFVSAVKGRYVPKKSDQRFTMKTTAGLSASRSSSHLYLHPVAPP